MCTRSVRSSIFSLRGIRAARSAGIRSSHRPGGSSTCASPEFTHILSVIPSSSLHTRIQIRTRPHMADDLLSFLSKASHPALDGVNRRLDA